MYKIIKYLFSYKDGILIWKQLSKNNKKSDLIGKEAGTIVDVSKNGYNYKYVGIRINKKRYRRSVLVFCLFNKRFPKINNVIDHINGNPIDDRIENLRECTASQNMGNILLKKKKTFNKNNYPIGIYKIEKGKYLKYSYRFNYKNKEIYKSFKTLKEAKKEYINKRKELFGEFYGRES